MKKTWDISERRSSRIRGALPGFGPLQRFGYGQGWQQVPSVHSPFVSVKNSTSPVLSWHMATQLPDSLATRCSHLNNFSPVECVTY